MTDIVEERAEEGIARVKAPDRRPGPTASWRPSATKHRSTRRWLRAPGWAPVLRGCLTAFLDMSRMFAAEVHMFGDPRQAASTATLIIPSFAMSLTQVPFLDMALDRAAAAEAADAAAPRRFCWTI